MLTFLCVLAVHHFDGVVKLALSIASKLDPTGIGLHYHKSGRQRDDLQGKESYMLRYDLSAQINYFRTNNLLKFDE